MFGLVATTAALMAGSALATNVGSAVVVNQCSYPVYLSNVPASGGGFSEINKLLQTDDTYTQQWTPLSNTAGWSIKLSKDGQYGDNIMQYEYTYNGGNIIWYDLSEVNGNPWRGDFEITAESQSSCVPRQVAYRFATDDAYGMQDCPADSTITVALCSGDDSATGGAGSGYGSSSNADSNSEPAETTEAAPAAVPATTTQAAPTTVIPSPTTTATPTTAAYTPPAAAPVESPATTPSQEAAPLSSSTADVKPQVATIQTDSTTMAPAQTTTKPVQTPVQKPTPTTLETVTVVEWVTIDTTETAWVHSKRHIHHPHHGRH